MARRAIAMMVGALLACTSASELRVVDLPLLPADTQSVVLVVDSDLTPAPPGERLMLRAYPIASLESAVVTLEFEEAPTSKINLLAYAEPLGALGIAEGKLELAGADGRGLPDPNHTYAWLEPADGAGWREEPYSDALRMLRIAPLDFALCLERGGCLEGGGNALLCNLSCDPGPEPLPPEPPAEPEPPSIWSDTCPVGTATTTLLERPLSVCDPAPALIACGAAEAQPPTSSACVALDAEPCPHFPTIPRGRSARYVDAASAPGGDGRFAAPFTTVAEALAASSPGDVIALAPGAYLEPAILGGDRSLLGACAATTSVGPITFSGTGAIGGVLLQAGGLVITAGAELRLDAVAIEGGDLGIRVEGGRATGRGVVVRGAANGIEVVAGGRLELSNVYVEGAAACALRVEGPGSSAVLDDLVIRGSGQASVRAQFGAALTLNRALIEGGQDCGLLSKGATTSVEVSDLVVRDFPTPSHGIFAEAGGAVLAHRTRIARTGGAGLSVDVGSRAVAEDLRIADVGPASADELAGHGISLGVDGHLELTRTAVERVPRAGLLLGRGSTSVISDLVVEDALDFQASAAIVVDGGHLELDRARLLGLYAIGMEHIRESSFSDVADVEIEVIGGAINVSKDGTLFFGERIWAHDNFAWGLTTGEGARSEVRDLRISRIDGTEAGSGVSANLLEALVVDRFIIEDCASPATDLALIGIQQGEKRLSHGRIRRNAIALKITPTLPSLLSTFDRVVFEDNGRLYAE